MKKILAPTDFSLNAEKALEYALHLSAYFSSELILLHSWTLPHQKSAMFISIQNAIREKAEKDLLELKHKILLRFPEIKIKTIAVMGEPADSIKSIAKNTGADYIIMGTKGASGIKKYFFGSNTAEVIDDAPCPVFAVPEKAVYKNIKNIGFATDLNKDDIVSITSMIDIAKLFNAKIIITHITENGENEENKFNSFIHKIEKRYSDIHFDSILLTGNDVVEKLNQFVCDKNIDILTIARRKRDFYESLFHKSISKEMAYSSSVPIIVFQDHPDPEIQAV